jgi:hypothetical protein
LASPRSWSAAASPSEQHLAAPTGGSEYLTTILQDIAAPIEFAGSGTLVADVTVMRAQPDTDMTPRSD